MWSPGVFGQVGARTVTGRAAQSPDSVLEGVRGSQSTGTPSTVLGDTCAAGTTTWRMTLAGGGGC